jgi:hypothetical protein
MQQRQVSANLESNGAHRNRANLIIDSGRY